MKKETKQKIIKLLVIVLLLVVIALAIYLPLKLTGTLEKIDSAEKLRDIILDFGAYSYIIFFVIQFLQTTILPIPAMVTTVAGTLIFGPWITFALSFAAIFTGSMVSFLLGKKIGRRLVVWVAGEKDAVKWEKKLQRGKFVFFLMMLFPIFPDDILCLVVGTTNMSYKFFIITNLITRPISIITICFFGSGQLIPFSGWGIPVWIVLAVLAVVVFYLSIKYQQQIEDFILKLAGKLTGKKKHESESIKEDTQIEETIQIDNKDNENSMVEKNIEDKKE